MSTKINRRSLPSLMVMAAILVSALAFQASADDRATVRAILDKIGRKDDTVEDVAEFNREGRVIKLNLSRRGLSGQPISEFPVEIFRLTALKGLLMKGNALTSLPHEIGGMAELIELDLANNNDLKELPPSIGNLSNLKMLDVRFCGLSNLPFGFGNLKSLEKLQLWGNEFTELPHAVTELTALKDLHLNNNKLTTLPVEITKLPNLSYIDTQRNVLCKVPPQVEAWLTSKDKRWKDHQWCDNVKQ